MSPTLNLPSSIVVIPMLDAGLNPSRLQLRACRAWGYVLFR